MNEGDRVKSVVDGNTSIKEVNLEEIYNQFEYLSRVQTDSRVYYKENMIKAMREACRQVLELASENAEGMSIVTEIEPCGMDDYIGVRKKLNISYVVNKESITNTIKQVK